MLDVLQINGTDTVLIAFKFRNKTSQIKKQEEKNWTVLPLSIRINGASLSGV